MAEQRNRAREPTPDPAIDEIAADPVDADTEGHSMLTLELGRTIESDRVRETEKAGREHARAREVGPQAGRRPLQEVPPTLIPAARRR